MTIDWRANPGAAGTITCAVAAGVAAGAFLVATAAAGQYPQVARLGGAGWVFLLSMIILMPTLMPRVRDRLSKASRAETPRAATKEATMATVKDPVCGMEIEPSGSAGKETYQGKEFFFCSKSCQEQFRAQPQKYAGSPRG
jgi:YHS domain-containing protein